MDVRCLKNISSLTKKFEGNDMILAPSPPGVPYQLYNLMTQIVFGFSSNSTSNEYYNNGIMLVRKTMITCCIYVMRYLGVYHHINSIY